MPSAPAPTGPAGAWVVTLTTSDLGELRVPMNFEAQKGGAFRARSRSGALTRTVGRGRGLLARLFGGGAFAGGALLHIEEGESEVRGDTLHLGGVFLSSFSGRLRLTGTLVEDELTGELRRTGSGALWGTLRAVPAERAQPTRDYATLAEEVRQVITERIYNPGVLQNPQWQRFFSRLEQRLPRAEDDAEALTIFHLAAQTLELSHFALLGERFGEIELSRDGEQAEEPQPAVRLLFPQPSVAHLTIRHFKDAPEPIERAFAEIHAAGASTLILDLRGNPGGNLSSMSVATHLFREEIPAGVFIGPTWWRGNSALPDLHQPEELPTLSGYDLEAFFRILREHGVLAGRVQPREPHFGGPVFVLIDRRTASAAEPLAELLKREGRATLIGERTAGAMLSSEQIVLQSGLVLMVPTADYFTAEGRRLEGVGVGAEVEVPSAEALSEALRRAAVAQQK